jgi:1-acyl-sn-glycerol-3-phosphate acyltransferase
VRNSIPSQFNSIGVKLAKRAKVPVVPIALKTDAWTNGKRLKDFGPVFPDRKVHFAFGEPMTISGNGADQQKAIVEFIQTKLKSWSES